MSYNTYCFYHKVDWDGHASAAVVKYFVRDAILMPFNYNQPFPFDEIKKGDFVFFVDVVPSPLDDLLKIQEIVGVRNVVVIDHHKSFIDADICPRIVTYCDARYAACELAWMYFNYGDRSDMPRFIRLLGQYDSWREKPEKMHDLDDSWDTVMEFQYGIRLAPFSVTYLLDNFMHSDLHSDLHFAMPNEIEKTIEKGRPILTYQNNQNSIAMNNSFDFELQGFKCLCVNTGIRNSHVFASKWDAKKYDFMIAFSYNGKKWSYSAYTDRSDRSAVDIAKVYGGGGHIQASGFLSEEFLLK